MIKHDYPPLLPEGFCEIGFWQFDQHFLEPFGANERRLYLINRFGVYLEDLAKLTLTLTIWLDGSFTTHKPDPNDVDIVLWVDEDAVDQMPAAQQVLLDRLTDPDKVAARYDVHVHVARQGDTAKEAYWLNEFGTDRAGLITKGLFTLKLNHA